MRTFLCILVLISISACQSKNPTDLKLLVRKADSLYWSSRTRDAFYSYVEAQQQGRIRGMVRITPQQARLLRAQFVGLSEELKRIKGID
jgi:hypothetical protein